MDRGPVETPIVGCYLVDLDVACVDGVVATTVELSSERARPGLNANCFIGGFSGAFSVIPDLYPEVFRVIEVGLGNCTSENSGVATLEVTGDLTLELVAVRGAVADDTLGVAILQNGGEVKLYLGGFGHELHATSGLSFRWEDVDSGPVEALVRLSAKDHADIDVLIRRYGLGRDAIVYTIERPKTISDISIEVITRVGSSGPISTVLEA